jgi:hypothetical protein
MGGEVLRIEVGSSAVDARSTKMMHPSPIQNFETLGRRR